MFRYDSCGNKEERARTILDPYSVLKKEQKAHATMQILFTPKKKAKEMKNHNTNHDEVNGQMTQCLEMHTLTYAHENFSLETGYTYFVCKPEPLKNSLYVFIIFYTLLSQDTIKVLDGQCMALLNFNTVFAINTISVLLLLQNNLSPFLT
jgi:hypothetical protein